MADIKPTTACTAFHAHAWKKDTCTNCMKSRNAHTANAKSPVSPKSFANGISKKPSGATATNINAKKLKSSNDGGGVTSPTRTSNVTSPTRRTYNYGGYRTHMKRDNDSTDSQLSVKSNSSDKSTGSRHSTTKPRRGGGESTAILGNTSNRLKKGDSKDSNTTSNATVNANTCNNINGVKVKKGEQGLVLKKQDSCSVVDNIVKKQGSCSVVDNIVKKQDSCSVDNTVKTSPNGNNNVEDALKRLTSGVVSSPLCARKSTGSRTTMHYAASSVNNNNSVSPTATNANTTGKAGNSSVSPTATNANTTGKAGSGNSSWLHSGGSSRNRVSIPLDKSAGKLSATVNPENKIVDKTAVEQHSPVSSNNTVDGKSSKTSNVILKSTPSRDSSKTEAVKKTSVVEKRKVLIDKGKYSTEKIIFDKSTVITTGCKDATYSTSTVVTSVNKRASRIDTSSTYKPVNKTTEEKVVLKSEQQNTVGSKSAGQRSVNSKGNVVNAKTRTSTSGKISSSDKQQSDKTASSNTTGKVSIERPNSISPRGKVVRNQSSESQKSSTGSDKRARSRSTRPTAPPPCVPPNKALMESYHSDMSASPSAESQLSQLAENSGATDAKHTGADSSFSDLYNDIMNTLSETKDITLDKLKPESSPDSGGKVVEVKKRGSKDTKVVNSHYYHKYDRSSVSKNPGELTLSKAALGDGTSSIIIETMNTSFHAAVPGAGEVQEVTSQTLAMPYNIVDVSTIVPRCGKSPRLPSTPAPESRNSTLSRTTLRNKKDAKTNRASLERSDSASPRNSSTGSGSPVVLGGAGSGSPVVLGGVNKGDVGLGENQRDSGIFADNKDNNADDVLPPLKYWHTYEPIEGSDTNHTGDKAGKGDKASKGDKAGKARLTKAASISCDNRSTADNSDNSTGSFIRCSTSRATAPVRSKKSASVINVVKSSTNNSTSGSENSASLAHLDLDGDGKKKSPKKSPKSVKNSKISKSAEDLLEDMTDSLGEPKTRRNSIKKKNSGSGGGFFRRLFGLGRKDSVDDNTEGGDTVNSECESYDGLAACNNTQFTSIQENAEFFKPLKVDTDLGLDDNKDIFFDCSSSPDFSIGRGSVKSGSLSPSKLEVSSTLVAEIENAMSERNRGSSNRKELKLVIPNSDTSQTNKHNSDKTNQNHSPIAPYGTSKDVRKVTAVKSSQKPVISSTSKPKPPGISPPPKPPGVSPPPIPTTTPRVGSLQSKPVVSPKPSANISAKPAGTDSPKHRISPQKSLYSNQEEMKTSADNYLISPTPSDSAVTGSASQSSLHSDGGGSSDSRSLGSQGEGAGAEARPGRSRPRSQAISRKMLNAPPPPPPGAERRVSAELSPGSDTAPPGPLTPPKTSPTSPTRLLSNPFSGRGSGKNKSKRNSVGEDVYASKKPASPVKKLEISAPIELQSCTLDASQTLPRPLRRPMVQHANIKESQDDLATGRRKVDPSARQPRRKTVTEGVKFDVNLLNSGPEGERLAELLASKTTNKFVNRALPPTPAEPPPSAPAREAGSEGSRAYEWVDVAGVQLVRRSQSERTAHRPEARRTSGDYEVEEEEDIYTDPIESVHDILSKKSSLRSKSSLPGGAGRLTVGGGPALKAPPSLFTDYLEPHEPTANLMKPVKPGGKQASVIFGEEKGTLVKNKLSLGPKPKNLNPAGSRDLTKTNEAYVSMIYVNTEMIFDASRPPLDVGEGFRRMAFINVETLLHIANNVITSYLHTDAKIADDLKFSHFVLKSTKPYVHQGFVAYYNARTYKLKPNDCLLMISAKNINPDLLHHTCVHLLQPSLIFSDRILATYFPDVTTSKTSPTTSSSKVYQLGGMVQTNMAVITYHSIQPLSAYVAEVVGRAGTEAGGRAVCYLLYQLLSAVLSAHDGTSTYIIKTVKLSDVLVVTPPTGEPYLVVNPLSSGEVDLMEDEVLCIDLILLLCRFLNVNITTEVNTTPSVTNVIVDNVKTLHKLSAEAMSKIRGASKYISGLRKLVSVLDGGSISGIIVGRSVLECVLWGPGEGEMRSLLLAEDREKAFCIWLEVTRCKGVNELALGQLTHNLELAHMFHFLCTVTGAAMLDVTKLLYKA